MQNKIEKKFFLCEVITSQFFIVKFSLVRTGYLSSAANVLTSSPKIWHVNQRIFSHINCLASDQLI